MNSDPHATTALMCDGEEEVVRVVRDFAAAEEVQDLVEAIWRKRALFREVDGRYGIAPHYRVIHGVAVHDELPEIVAFGEERIRPTAEAFAGRPLAPIPRSPHDIRIQHFAEPSHNFRWHFDGHTYNALLTLVNTSAAQTQVMSPSLSRAVRRIYAPLAFTPRVLSLLPRRGFTADAGDLLLLRGEGLLHRGAAGPAPGQRLLIVYCFNEVGKPERRASWLRRRIVRAINFGYRS
jgi:hypothetical protein